MVGDDSRDEVVEELCVEVKVPETAATPFFDHETCRRILLKGGQIVNDDEIRDADVLIEDGIIVKIEEDMEIPEGVKVIDTEKKLIMPGGIDSSTNLHNRPNAGNKVVDDFDAGTRAALSGGTTMVVDLVMPEREESLLEAYREWKEDAESNSTCDFGFKVGIPEWNESVKNDLIELVKNEGVNAFKVFMAQKGVRMLKNEDLQEIFETCKEIGASVHVHAENGDIIAENEKRLTARGVTGPEGHLLARPEEVEEEAVQRACAMAGQINVPLIVDGPTSCLAANVIGKERSKGAVVSGDVTAAALALDGSHYFNSCWDHAAAFVNSPPLRDDPSTPDNLVAALNDGQLQMVSSDNKTFSMETKSFAGRKCFKSIPEGMNGIEDRMAIVWERGVERGKMSPQRFVAVTSANAAKAFNVYPRKGKIAEGSDADVVVWNRNLLREISAKTQQQKSDFNVFEGVKVHGAPEYVIVNGRVVVYEYELSSNPGNGNHVELGSFPNHLFDAVDDYEKTKEAERVAAERKASQERGRPVDRTDSRDSMFGVTTPRKSMDEPILNKRLGIYQRPMSAHGVRNQQDSTFSLAGGYNNPNDRRTSVKISSPQRNNLRIG